VLVSDLPEYTHSSSTAVQQEFGRLFAQFQLWHLERALARGPSDPGASTLRSFLNSCMLTLDGACKTSEELAPHLDVSPMALRCEAARARLSLLSHDRSQGVATGFTLPDVTELDSLRGRLVALPSPEVVRQPPELGSGPGRGFDVQAVVDMNIKCM
jgi:hypothetical protein